MDQSSTKDRDAHGRSAPEELEILTGKVPDMVGAIAVHRANASIQIAKIVAARELWTS